MASMADREIKVLITVGVGLQVAAVALGFTTLGWRGPLVAAGAALALGILAVWAHEGAKRKAFHLSVVAACLAVLVLATWHGFTDSPVAAWCYRVAFGLQAVAAILFMAFCCLFRLNRLW